MSALGMIHGLYRGGEVHVKLRTPRKNNQRQKRIWEFAKLFGKAVFEEARSRRIPFPSLSVWTAQLLLGLVSRNWCYWIFCYWPGNPRVQTEDLDREPQDVDELLACLRIDFAQPVYGLRLPVASLDDRDDRLEEYVPKSVAEYFDYLLGVRRRTGDDSDVLQWRLAIMGESGGRHPELVPGWRVRIKAEDSVLRLLASAFNRPKLNIINEGNEYYIRSTEFECYSEPSDVLNAANHLLRIPVGIVRLWVGDCKNIQGDAAEHISSGFELKGMLSSFSVRAHMWSEGGRAALLAGTEDAPLNFTLSDRIALLAQEDMSVRRVLSIGSLTDYGWADLFTMLEIAVSDVGGPKNVEKYGWATRSKIKLFERTANTVERGRHGREDWKPPKNPMTMPEARVLIHRILRGWITHKLENLGVDKAGNEPMEQTGSPL